MELPNSTTFTEFDNKLTSLAFRLYDTNTVTRSINKDSSLYFLDENTATFQYSLMFVKSNPLNTIFINLVDQLISNGFVQKIEEIRNRVRPPKTYEDNKQQKLTMDHLEICFIAILICLGFSCVVFIIECIFGYCTK
jgi:hypothetical protein